MWSPFVVFSFVLLTVPVILLFGSTDVAHNLVCLCSIAWQTLMGFLLLTLYFLTVFFSVAGPHFSWCQIPQDSIGCTVGFTA